MVCTRIPHPARPGARRSTVWTVRPAMSAVTRAGRQLRGTGSRSSRWRQPAITGGSGSWCWRRRAGGAAGQRARRSRTCRAGQDRPVNRTTGRALAGQRTDAGSGWLGSLIMINDGDVPRDCRGWWCRCAGRLRRPGICSSRSGWSMPTAWWSCRRRRSSRELAACGRPATTQRSYGMDLLRWFRFLWAVGVGWDQATRAEARDFCCWMQAGGSSRRGRTGGIPAAERPGRAAAGAGVAEPGDRQAVSGPRVCGGDGGALRERAARLLRLPPGGWAPGRWSTRSRWPGIGGPAGRTRITTRWSRSPGSAAGRYRPKVVRRVPRQIPDERFDELFARLGSHRDRALVAFWVSTGARASELLGATAADADPGQQLITVIRKGTRVLQQLPAVPGRVRVAAAVSGADARAGARRAGSAAVVDAAAPVPGADLRRGPGDVHPGQRRAGRELVAA